LARRSSLIARIPKASTWRRSRRLTVSKFEPVQSLRAGNFYVLQFVSTPAKAVVTTRLDRTGEATVALTKRTHRRSQNVLSGFKKSSSVLAVILTFGLLAVLSVTVLAAHSPLQDVQSPPLRTTFETPPATPPAPLRPEASDARYYQAALYSVQARQELEAHRWHNALLLSLEAAQLCDDSPVHAVTVATLRDVLAHPMRETLYLPHDLPVGGAAWNHDETRFLVWLGSTDPNCDLCRFTPMYWSGICGSRNAL
jgi:hypothetical protein